MTARDVSPIRFIPPRPATGAYNTSPDVPPIEVVDADPKLSSVPGSVDTSALAGVAPIQQAARPQPSSPVLDELIRRQDEALAAGLHAPQATTVPEEQQAPATEDLRPKRTPAQIAHAEKLAQANRERAAAKRKAKEGAAPTPEQTATPTPEKPAPAVKDSTDDEDIF